MKELKFRVWDKERECYLDRSELAGITPDGKYILYIEEEEISKLEIEGNYVVEQYTGLKDKNGKEIYENDIVEYTTLYCGNTKRHRKAVEWKEWYSDDFGEPLNIGYFNLSECMEVIGNVHESNMEELCPKE